MKSELTTQETELMSIVKDKWINRAFKECSEGIDETKFQTGINWLYGRFLKLKSPTIVYCDSLVDAAIKITLVKDLGKELSDFNPDMTKGYEDGVLDLKFDKQIKENLTLSSSYIGWSNFGWVAFYDYFTQIKVIDNEDFNNYQKLIESNVFESFEFEKVVFAVKPPIHINYNELNQPHSINEASIVFLDGSRFYRVNGFSLSKELFTSLKEQTYTVKEFLSENNEEVKSAVISFIQERDGEEGIYRFLQDYLNEVDTYVNKKDGEFMEGTTNSSKLGVYTLFKGRINTYDIAYVRCYCPSTDRMFFLGVEPTHTKAKDAIASLYQVPRILVDKISAINRQGEVFSTVFDEETTQDLKNGKYTDEQLKTYTNVSGDTYFKLMKYEY
jgi:hypothetical protein